MFKSLLIISFALVSVISFNALAFDPTTPVDALKGVQKAKTLSGASKLSQITLKSITLSDLAFSTKAENIATLIDKAAEAGKLPASKLFHYAKEYNKIDNGDEILLKCIQSEGCDPDNYIAAVKKSNPHSGSPAEQIDAQPKMVKNAPKESANSKSAAMVHGGKKATQQISYSELPLEAQQTLKNIEKGGPFPYAKDGATFHNREGKIPEKEPGYYREYTVETPGASNRGARRIIVGKNGEKYYTDDHYETFMEIIK